MLFDELSNWGRWGPDDQRGALNLMTPERVRAAAGLVRDGVTVNLSLPLPTEPAPDNPHPVVHTMTRAGDVASEYHSFLDYVGMLSHGQSLTHLDALCHFFWRGQLYNGRPVSLVTSKGARANGVEVTEDGIVGRGVLLDIPHARGVSYLEPGEAIFIPDLEAAERAHQIQVGSGDILLVRTGRGRRREEFGPWNAHSGLAGLDGSCARWLRERDVAVLGCDGISDVLPTSVEGGTLPIHTIVLVAMGVHLLDNVQLEDVAAACAARERWEFLLTIGPLRLVGGTSSPINPVAVF